MLACSYAGLHAQSDWKKEFPAAEAVYTRMNVEVNIKKSGDKLVATREYTEDLVYLTDNSVKMMSRGQIYHSSFNELQKWEAYTLLENKKMKVSNPSTKSSRSESIFWDDVKATSFDYTGATVGATRHLEYQMLSNDVTKLTPHYFERYFPVGQGELKIIFPEDVKLKYIIKGMNADKVQFTESRKKDKTIYSFTVANLNGIQPYEDAPDNSWYSTHLIFYIEQVKENGVWKNFLSSPADLYRHNYNYIKDINKNLSPELTSLADSLVQGTRTDEEKARKIYRWVQSHIKYVAFEEGLEGFVPREANLVCSRRFGDCKDMASILVAMLNHVKVPAYFTWIGTRSLPYDYTDVPLPIVDNHMICTIKLGEEYIFLDGTDEGCIFGMPASHIQGKQAMLSINASEYKILRVPVMDPQKSIYSDSTFIEVGEKTVTGKIKIRMTGYYASSMRTILNFRNQKEREEYFKGRFGRGSNKIRFSNWKVDHNEDHSQVWITADMELPDYAKKLGDEWYLNMNLFKFYEHQEIDYPKRKMPIEYEFQTASSYVTVVKVPAGYKASYVPKSQTFKNDAWGFVMQYETKANNVYLTQEFVTDRLMLQPDQFEACNKVLEHLFPHYKQSIALTKN